jgi:hypothetical protein
MTHEMLPDEVIRLPGIDRTHPATIFKCGWALSAEI